MSLNSASQLGQMIGTLANEQEVISQNISPDDAYGQLQLVNLASVLLSQTVIASSLTYPTNSFIIDHCKYGEINSSILKIDGGYIKNKISILSNCDDYASWTTYFCDLSDNSTTYYAGDTHAINVAKSGTSDIECFALRSLTPFSIIDSSLSYAIYIKDAATLAKINLVGISVSNNAFAWELYKQVSYTSLVVGWNIMTISPTNYTGITGTIDLANCELIVMQVQFKSMSNTVVAGDIILDYFTYYIPDTGVVLTTVYG